MSSKNKYPRKIWVLFGVVALSIFLCDAACQAEMMHACVNKFTKRMRMVDAPKNCSRYFENPVSWNNVPQEVLDAHEEALGAAQATIARLTEQLTSLESEKVDPVRRRVDILEEEEIPAVTREIDDNRTRVTDVEQALDETDVSLSETAADVDTIRDTLEDADDGVITRLSEADARVLVLEDALSLDDAENCVITKVDVLEQTLEEDVRPIIQELDVDRAVKLSQLASYMRVENVAEASAAVALSGEETDPPLIIFEGVNVHIRSGLGATDDGGSGLGNLIIGYNELPEETAEATVAARKTAAHNLVIGPYHSYASVGGLVAGCRNVLAGSHVTVLGGENNRAEGFAVTVSGGTQNTATDDLPLVPFGELFEDPMPDVDPPAEY